MIKSKISFQISASGPDLLFTAKLDGQEMLNITPTSEPQILTVEFDDHEDGKHLLEFVMSGKTIDHTKIDDQGNIVEDRVIRITDISLDDIDLNYIFTKNSVYLNDRNGTQDAVQEPFYDVMGCNGVVQFRFTTPVYLWLLENL